MYEWIDWLNIGVQITLEIVTTIGLLFLCRGILAPRFRKTNLSFWMTAGLYLLYRFILQLLPDSPHGGILIITFIVIELFFYFGVLKLCFTNNTGLLAYVALTQVAAFRLCRFLAMGLISFISRSSINLLQNIQDEYWAQCIAIISAVIQDVFILIGPAIPFLWITRSMGKRFPKTHKPLNRQEISVLLLPNIAAIALCVVFQLITAIYDRDTARYELIFDKEPLTMLAIPFAALVLMILLLSTLRVFTGLLESYEQRWQKDIMASQLDGLQQHIHAVEQLYSGIRGLKHDMKNHLQHIAGLAQAGQYDQVEQYIESAETTLGALDFAYHTGNPVTDVIINQYGDHIAKRNLRFECEFIYPQAFHIAVFELAVILDNVLDNAVCAAQSYVKLRGYSKGSLFFIECANDYIGRITFDPQTGLPVTTKEDADEHGMGLRNVQRSADKYSGTLDIQTANDVFLLTVMLKSPKY